MTAVSNGPTDKAPTATSATPPVVLVPERPSAFYLGRTVARPTGARSDDEAVGAPFFYEANHLTTHGVVVGMTGSGKTGLSIGLLEEAALAGIGAIVVDPKGDLGNLLLSFPDLAGPDFAPWIPKDAREGRASQPGAGDANGEAARAAARADDEAKRWREGLASWGQDGAKIAQLRERAAIALYTPGSRVGKPLSILGSLRAPNEEESADPDLLSERISQVATSLLGLVGIDAEPGKTREHALLANILKDAWESGEDLDLASLVTKIQDPPFERVGVLELQAYFPKKDRAELAVAYNGLLASPGFDAWLSGDPLDVGALLATPDGKPKISILSIAHLGDAERMFFVSLLLGQLVGWMRLQPGTPNLRALFFMDECVGFFPPVAMPPSKRPLLLLLKQARAFGLGVVLATQNPVDLDYKGLSNAGTWIIGRLQTERDKARVLDGLEGVSGGSGFDRSDVDRLLSGLAKRQFYVHDVHASGPAVIESRWTLSYLRGPLTREEIKRLAGGKAAPKAVKGAETKPDARKTATGEGPDGTASALPVNATAPMAAPRASSRDANATQIMPARPSPSAPPAPVREEGAGARPSLPDDVHELFLHASTPTPHYQPMILGAARVTFEDAKTGLDFARDVAFVTPLEDGPLPVRWEDSKWAGSTSLNDLPRDPAPGATFAEVPPQALKAKSYAAWSKELVRWLTQTQGVARFKIVGEKIYSAPGEDEATFRQRVVASASGERSEAVAEAREKYSAKIASVDEKIRTKQAAVSRRAEHANARQFDAVALAGSSVLGLVSGGPKKLLSKAAAAAKKANQASRHAESGERDRAALAELMTKRQALVDEANAVIAEIEGSANAGALAIESVVAKPKKTGVTVHVVALAWVPVPADAPA